MAVHRTDPREGLQSRKRTLPVLAYEVTEVTGDSWGGQKGHQGGDAASPK